MGFLCVMFLEDGLSLFLVPAVVRCGVIVASHPCAAGLCMSSSAVAETFISSANGSRELRNFGI
jgi:hypothetical protein